MVTYFTAQELTTDEKIVISKGRLELINILSIVQGVQTLTMHAYSTASL